MAAVYWMESAIKAPYPKNQSCYLVQSPSWRLLCQCYALHAKVHLVAKVLLELTKVANVTKPTYQQSDRKSWPVYQQLPAFE